MMVLYDKLYRSGDFREVSAKEYLTSLVDEVTRNFPNRGQVTIETHIEDLPLDASTLTPLGIITNELLSNAMKHAFTGRDKGKVRVSFSTETGQATLTIRDDGRSIPESVDMAASTGFGLQLVNLITRQLRGTIELNRDNGTEFRITFSVW